MIKNEKDVFSYITTKISDEDFKKGQIIQIFDESFFSSPENAQHIFEQVNIICIPSKNCPGILSIRILAPRSIQISENLISYVIQSWNPDNRFKSLFSFSTFPIEIRIQKKHRKIKSYACQSLDIKYYLDNQKLLEAERLERLENELLSLFSHSNNLIPFILSSDLAHDKKILYLRQNLIHDIPDTQRRIADDILEEFQRFFLAVEKEFLRLRSQDHIAAIIKTHVLLKKSGIDLKQLRTISLQAFPSLIKYPFGNREVLSLVIFVSYLDDYERLCSGHIVEAIQYILSEINLVPESFYSYRYSYNKAASIYLEIEKKGNLPFSDDELYKINTELSSYISSAIEPVVSRIDIPINEEEHLRNILLLSQELKSKKDKPQVIIQFVKQHAMTLEFSITLMKVGNEGEVIDIENIEWSKTPEHLHIVPVSSSTVGYVRSQYPKLVLSCFAHCAKKPFSRPNKTIDYVRSREYIITSLEHIFGPLRDVNGGLIGKRKQFFSELKSKLSVDELREIDTIESLFQNISSPIIKSSLSSSSILFLYRSIRNLFPSEDGPCVLLTDCNIQKFIKEDNKESCDEVLKYFYCILFTTEQKVTEKALVQQCVQKNISDKDRALSYITLSDGEIIYLLLLRQHEVEIPISQVLENIQRFIYETSQIYLENKSIRISLPRPTLLLDPRVGTDRTSGILIKMLYEGLMRLDLNGKPQEALAESIVISDDRKRYSFYLKKTIWSNGLPVTAYDFEYAWKKILDPSFKTIHDYLFHPIKNARVVKAGMKSVEELGVRAVSTYELIVDLEIPAPYFLELLCHWIYSPLSKEMDINYPGWAYYAEDTYVSNGPFRLTKWKRETEIQVIKNRVYWDQDSVHLNKIDIAIIEDSTTAMQLYTQGQLDWIGEPLTEIPTEVLLSKPKELISHPISNIQWFVFNIHRMPFQSKKIRQAFYIALNKQAIIDTALFGDESIASSILPKNLSSQKNSVYTCNLDEAKKLFDEGLLELGITKDEIPILTLKVYDQQIMKAVAFAIQKQWEEAFGITIRVITMSWSNYIETLPEFDYDIISIMWSLWFLDPMYTFESLSSLSNSMNLSQWQHPEFITIFQQAQKETSEIKRKRLIAKLEHIVMEEMPIIPTFEYSLHYMKNPRLSHVFLSESGNIDFRFADLSNR